MSETPELPPLDREDDVEGSLGWHALNYRTAHTSHAQGMYEELERWVSAYGRECMEAGRRAGLEEAAKLAEKRGASCNRSDFQSLLYGCARAIRLR